MTKKQIELKDKIYQAKKEIYIHQGIVDENLRKLKALKELMEKK